MNRQYTLQDFDFELPNRLIAQQPAKPRDHARLLIYDRSTKSISDDYFYNLNKYLIEETALVINSSKVEKCRLLFGDREIFVLESTDPFTFKALVKPGRKFPVGKLVLDGIKLEILSIDEDGQRLIRLDRSLEDTSLDQYRFTPLPPYIKQNEKLASQYQTVYADTLGSKAAPTAGLHFTNRLLDELKKQHHIIPIALHVGLGTFAPVKSQNLEKHNMHSEHYFVSQASASKLNHTKHITAIGTTSLRTLESLDRPFIATAGDTNIFILPGYKFKNVDSLVTNFHIPKSTLLMLISAFMGSVEEMHRVYDYAISQNYRFYSFGDAMLIL
jgi:S-adenosylmethionine:tRNA ribosyltransferase-isomerase